MQCAEKPGGIGGGRRFFGGLRPASIPLQRFGRYQTPCQETAVLNDLISSLALSAFVAVALTLYRFFDKNHPMPSQRNEAMAGRQGTSALILISVVLSAVVPFICFTAFGPRFPEAPLEGGSLENASFVGTLATYVLVCVATGFYEEGAFRVVIPGLFERGFAGNGIESPRRLLLAVLLSGILFAVLHVSSPLSDGFDEVMVLQALLKFAQGMLFSLTMFGLLLKTGSFTLVVAAHASYDLLFFLPWLIDTGGFPSTYLTGIFVDVVALAVNCVCLIPAAVASARLVACGGEMQ